MSDYTWYVSASDLPDGWMGWTQLLFLLAAYGYLLYLGASLLSDGTERLYAIKSIARSTGTIIIPLMLVIPECLIVLYSGLSSDSDVVEIALGTVFGSSIMVLTVPWALAIYYARVPLDGDGRPVYPKRRRSSLPPPLDEPKETWESALSSDKGIAMSSQVRRSALLLVIATVTYWIVQTAALWGVSAKGQRVDESIGAAVAFIMAAAYMAYAYIVDVEMGKDPLAFLQKPPQIWTAVSPRSSKEQAEAREPLLPPPPSSQQQATPSQQSAVAPDAKVIDDDLSGSGQAVEEDSVASIPRDLRGLPAREQTRQLVWRAVGLLTLGLVITTLFAAPMVDVLDGLGTRLGIGGFYTAFVLAPLLSVAEVVTAIQYARRKTRACVSIAFTQLLGAAILNQTVVLGVLLIQLAVQERTWDFGSETIACVAAQYVLALYMTKPVHTSVDALIVLLVYPVTLVLVALLRMAGL